MSFLPSLLFTVVATLTLPLAVVAEEELHEAGLVIRNANGELTYAIVHFTEEEISGIDLLERSSLDIVTVEFGGLGAAVCSISGSGCGVDDCRQRLCQSGEPNAPYWRYFSSTGAGTWEPVTTGASSRMIRDGTIDGWSWSPDQPNLPAVSLAEIRELAGMDRASEAESSSISYAADGTILSTEDTGQDPAVYAGAFALLMAVGLFSVLASRGARHRSELE